MLLQLIIIQIVTFGAIIVVLRKLLYTETAKEAQRLRSLKEENAERQRELQQKMQSAEAAYQQKIAQAEDTISQMHKRAKDEMELTKREMLDKAKEEAEQIVKAAFNTKEKIREEIALEMKRKVPELAAQMFEEFLSPEMKMLVHQELIKEVINHVRTIEKKQFKIKVKKGEFISAYPLESKQKEHLASSIRQKLGYKITYDERVDKKLIAGTMIRLGTIVIDGSLENRLRQFEERMKGA